MLCMRQFYLNHDMDNVPMDIRQIYALLMEKFPDHHEKWRVNANTYSTELKIFGIHSVPAICFVLKMGKLREVPSVF